MTSRIIFTGQGKARIICPGPDDDYRKQYIGFVAYRKFLPAVKIRSGNRSALLKSGYFNLLNAESKLLSGLKGMHIQINKLGK